MPPNKIRKNLSKRKWKKHPTNLMYVWTKEGFEIIIENATANPPIHPLLRPQESERPEILCYIYHCILTHLRSVMIKVLFCHSIDCGYSLEPPHRGGSNEYLQSSFIIKTEPWSEYPIRPCMVFKVNVQNRRTCMQSIVVHLSYVFDHDQTVSSDPGLPCLHIYHNSDQSSSYLHMH